MKRNKLYLVSAVLFLIAGACFCVAAAFQAQAMAKGLCGAAAVCMVFAGLGFFDAFMRGK